MIMSKFARTDFNLKRLVDNSYKAIDQGAYEIKQSFTHDGISLKKTIRLCAHAPLVTEIKFSSPSQGKIRSKTDPAEIAKIMVDSGAIGISVLTQPSLFDGSIEYLATIRRALMRVPVLMKDITVSTIQIDAGKKAGADCVLLIKSIFDHNLAEDDMDKLSEHAKKRGLEVIVEVHTEQEFEEVLKSKLDLIGINNRDLDNFHVDIKNTEKLLKRYNKANSTIISESGINSPEDIRHLRSAGADAFLVGTSVMQAPDIAAKISDLYYAL
jgi:indole-3-glycerol phosphate synthase